MPEDNDIIHKNIAILMVYAMERMSREEATSRKITKGLIQDRKTNRDEPGPKSVVFGQEFVIDSLLRSSVWYCE